MRDYLDTCYEIIKLIKFSPKHNAILNSITEEVGDDAPWVRTLCPTCWTVCAQSIASILANYKNIQDFWDALEGSLDSEIKARIQGVSSQMETFQFFFGMLLAEMVFRYTDNLSKTLKNLNCQVYRDKKLLC